MQQPAHTLWEQRYLEQTWIGAKAHGKVILNVVVAVGKFCRILPWCGTAKKSGIVGLLHSSVIHKVGKRSIHVLRKVSAAHRLKVAKFKLHRNHSFTPLDTTLVGSFFCAFLDVLLRASGWITTLGISLWKLPTPFPHWWHSWPPWATGGCPETWPGIWPMPPESPPWPPPWGQSLVPSFVLLSSYLATQQQVAAMIESECDRAERVSKWAALEGRAKDKETSIMHLDGVEAVP